MQFDESCELKQTQQSFDIMCGLMGEPILIHYCMIVQFVRNGF